VRTVAFGLFRNDRPDAMNRERPVALALGGMVAMATGIGVGRFVYTPILPVMAESLVLSSSQTGLLASANFLGYLAGALMAMSPRLSGSRQRWLIGALILSAATTGAMGLVSTMPLFLLLRCVGGIACAFILVFPSALVLDHLSESGHGRLSSIHFAGVGVGIATAALLVAGLNAAAMTGGRCGSRAARCHCTPSPSSPGAFPNTRRHASSQRPMAQSRTVSSH
jgi:MFS family permease